MSIRPIDYTSLIPKSQEVAKIKQVESNKYKIQTEQGFIQQEKKVERNIKKVRDTNKSENLTINANKRNKGEQNKGNKKNKKRQKNKKEDALGGSIDIKI